MSVNRFVIAAGVLISVGMTLCAPLPAQDSCGPPGATTVIRTLAYHQITSFATDLAMTAPVLSGSGNKIAFTNVPGTGSAASPNEVYTVNPDGTGQVKVDSYVTKCFCGSYVDLSNDGGKVLSTDAVQLRVANGDGTGALSLIVLSSNEISAIRISGDGSKVFFRIYRDTGNLGPDGTAVSTPIQRGLWTINADGTGLRQLVGPTQLAQVQGTTVDQSPFWNAINGLKFNSGIDTNTDGSRVVFSTFLNSLPGSGGSGQAAYGVNLDGSNLHPLTERQDWLYNVAISADGGKVAVSATPSGRDSSQNDLTIRNFDGSGAKVLRTFSDKDALQLSGDGSKLLVGGADAVASLLIDTASGDATQLAALTGGSGGQTTVLYNGLAGASMNDSATRFGYLMDYIRCADCANQPKQLAILELNPANLGASPKITETKIDPPYTVADNAEGSSPSATVTARVTTDNALQSAGVNFFLGGIYDVNMRAADRLFDDATNGDVTAGDKLFTTNQVRHSYIVIRDGDKDKDIGPRTVRAQAEVKDGSGRLHATAVEFEPFSVVKTAPIPAVAEIHPRQARRGNVLTDMVIEGGNISGTPTLTFLLNGQPDPTITVSDVTVADSGKVRFTLNLPSSVPIGDRVVQLTTPAGVSSAAPSAANTFTVSEIDVNGDNSFDVGDAITVLRKIVGIE